MVHTKYTSFAQCAHLSVSNEGSDIIINGTQLINQSMKIYIAPLKDPYSEALPTQAKRSSRSILETVL